MATAIDAITGLPLLKWAGLPAPAYDDVSFQFGHSHGEIPYPYVSGVGHDWTGMDGIPIKLRLMFLASLDETYFPELWNRWWEELQSGEPATMIHPILGEVLTVVRGGDIRITSQTRAGVIAEINFTTTIEDPEEELVFEPLTVNLEALAAAAVEEADNANIKPPSEESATDITDGVAQIEGFTTQLDLAAEGIITKTQAIAADFVTACELVKSAGSFPGNHSAQLVEDLFIGLWDGLEQTKSRLGENRARPTSTAVLSADTSLDAFARENGNSLPEVIALNPAALLTPTVPRGTVLKFYK